MTLVSCLVAVLSFAATRTAWAERAIAADVAPVVPFDAAELTSALRARLPDGDAIQIRISPTFDGGVRIETRGALREVPLRGLTGPAAARLVALAAADLLVDDDIALEPPSLVARRRPTTIGVLGAAAAWGQTFGGLGLDVALPRGSTYLVAIEGAAGTLVDGPVRMTAAIVRLGIGARRGMFELRATGTIAPLMVSSGAGDQTILAGAGASVRLRIPIADDLHFILAGGADVFATRTTYIIDGMPSLTTPRTAPWAAAGLELTP